MLDRGLQGHRIVSVAAGDYHAAAVDDQGRVFAWVSSVAATLPLNVDRLT